jgi:soluble lytic murein transglycosylase-like protein
MVNDAGAKHGVDPLLGLAVAASESSFNPLAISNDGMMSKGLFQLLDTTGKEIHEQHGYQTPYNPFDPALNVDLGVSYLRRLHDLFSTTNVLTNNIATSPAANSTSLEKLAVAAFNAGEGRVASAQRRAERAGGDPSNFAAVAPYLPDSTQEYVNRVFQFREQYRSRFEDSGDAKRGEV